MTTSRAEPLIRGVQRVLKGDEPRGPFYLYDLDALCATIRALTTLVHRVDTHRGRVYFPMFANPSLGLLDHLVNELPDLGILVNSAEEGEALRNHALGDRGDRVFTGGVVGDEALRLLVQSCGTVHCASLGDLRRLCGLIRRGGPVVSVGVRLDLAGTALKGLTPAELPEARQIAREAGCEITSIHGYPGTEIDSVDELLHHAELLLDVVEEYPARILNFGGGFGYDYKRSRPSVDLGVYVTRLRESLTRRVRSGRLDPATELAWEPGRILAAASGVYVTRVIEVRPRAAGFCDVYVDGCFSHLPAPKIRGRQHRVSVLDSQGGVGTATGVWARLCGASTLSTDTLLPGRVLLPRPSAGDRIVIWDVGCYGRAGSYNFLGRCLPAEYGVDGETLDLLTPAQTVDQMFSDAGIRARGREAWDSQGAA